MSGRTASIRFEVGVELGDVAREFLAERQRHRVHQVGAADFDDVGELLGLGVQRVAQLLHRGHQQVDDLLGRRDMHRGRKRVVGGLRHIDVVVGMDRLLAAHLAAGQFDRAVRDDLVGVHVGLGAAAGLPDAQRKLGVELARGDLLGRLHDQPRLVGGELAQILVDLGGGLLEQAEGADHRTRHPVGPDIEVMQ